MFQRVILIVLDACGVGEMPDAADYGDAGAATLPHVAEACGGLSMPHSARLGLGNIVPIAGLGATARPRACYGKMAEKSPGKDSTSGHWEIGGIILPQPFPVYPDGFPRELVEEFEHRAGIKTIGNIAASGTEIIEQLGHEHVKTGHIILYTSADSVFQLAAHEKVIPNERLYEICGVARELLTGEHAVGRVIARPFIGAPGKFTRTTGRRDFSLKPPDDTYLDRLTAAGITTVGIGKIGDLFAGQGLARTVKAENNRDVILRIIDEMKLLDRGVIMANLVDFDMLWGHRNDAVSFGHGLEDFDRQLIMILGELQDDDLLVITADHGCDPTQLHSTDHSREYVPLLVYNHRIYPGIDLGTRESFADIAATVADIFGLDATFPGRSFFGDIQTAAETTVILDDEND